jgi:hypothetical protein
MANDLAAKRQRLLARRMLASESRLNAIHDGIEFGGQGILLTH